MCRLGLSAFRAMVQGAGPQISGGCATSPAPAAGGGRAARGTAAARLPAALPRVVLRAHNSAPAPRSSPAHRSCLRVARCPGGRQCARCAGFDVAVGEPPARRGVAAVCALGVLRGGGRVGAAAGGRAVAGLLLYPRAARARVGARAGRRPALAEPGRGRPRARARRAPRRAGRGGRRRRRRRRRRQRWRRRPRRRGVGGGRQPARGRGGATRRRT